MILIVSHRLDAHVVPVTEQLDRVGGEWLLLDTDEYPDLVGMTMDATGCLLRTPRGDVRLEAVDSVWWRRPRPPRVIGRDADVAAWAERQAFAALDSALGAIEGRWVNHPRANRRAEDKPANLRRAAGVGLDVPAWCVTNDPAAARDFARVAGDLVVKPVESGFVSETAVLWTRRVEEVRTLDELGPEPYLLQRFVDKAFDVRVALVGDELFAVRIDSQARPESRVDMRAGGFEGLEHRQIDLPADVAAGLIALMAVLELRFAAIDLVVDRDGRYWFLELNPNGQWAWLDRRAGTKIARAIAELLR